MKKFIRLLFYVLLLFSGAVLGTVGYYDAVLADSYCVAKGRAFELSDKMLTCTAPVNAVQVQKNGSENVNGYNVNVSVLGFIPIKMVNVREAEETEVLVLGTPFGIKMHTEGVLVVGYSDVETENGTVNPAKNVGVEPGDIILQIDGVDINSNEQVQRLVFDSNGKSMSVLVKRNQRTFTVNLTPVLSKVDKYHKLGLWIRDSSAGIGTMTFYSPSNRVFAGLGHGICDADTGKLIPFESGQMAKAEIVGIKKSTADATGELQGVFSGGDIADIACNDVTGVFGVNCREVEGDNVMPIAFKQEIKPQAAKILTTLNDEGPKLYDCIVEKIYCNDKSKIKNIVIKITDKELLKKTGGIVQGMSGSPIIQNGKLIGAVTHVFVNDSTRGYGIFAENMLETAQSVAEQQLKEAS